VTCPTFEKYGFNERRFASRMIYGGGCRAGKAPYQSVMGRKQSPRFGTIAETTLKTPSGMPASDASLARRQPIADSSPKASRSQHCQPPARSRPRKNVRHRYVPWSDR